MSPAIRRHLLEIFDDHQNAQDLRQELAAVVDADVHFVSATCYLEKTHRWYFPAMSVSVLLHVQWLLSITPYNSSCSWNCWWKRYHIQPAYDTAKACIQPGLNFYQQKFSIQFHRMSYTRSVLFKLLDSAALYVRVQNLNPMAAFCGSIISWQW